MTKANLTESKSIFNRQAYRYILHEIRAEIQQLYLNDAVPWVIGYSGGKDSTAIVQLVWNAISELPDSDRKKIIHVISTDTLVENPVVALWVTASLEKMKRAAEAKSMPIQVHRLTPKNADSFWVNLIGKGYPAPRNKFRWCTERLKISPSHNFIRSVVQENGEAILVLGTRKAESSARAHNMSQHAKKSTKARLTPNSGLLNSLVYTPIEDWSNDDVWTFLMKESNPWGNNNKDLLTMYRGASADGECPLVMDTDTPSCGKSRFGCWVCTMVEEDKSMAAMIQNDQEKEWMLPLLEFRSELDFRSEKSRLREKSRRDFRRRTGELSYYIDKDNTFQLVQGPYTQETRAYFLQKLLQVQKSVQSLAPETIRNFELITIGELDEIRRIWVLEKHEIEDLVVEIYEKEIGKPYPSGRIDDNTVFDQNSLELLKKICGNNELHYELVRNLLHIEHKYRAMIVRHGLFKEIENEIKKCFYENEEDALDRAKTKNFVNQSAISADFREVSLFDNSDENKNRTSAVG